MDEASIRNLVKGWYRKARREGDSISRFVFFWVCFNAWLAFESGRETDRGMINWLKTEGRSRLRAAYDTARGSSVFRRDLDALVALAPISSSTPGRWPDVSISSAEDFTHIVEGIYRVRCNLFHGGKSANDVRDQKLVKVCARILEKWVGNLVGSWRTAA